LSGRRLRRIQEIGLGYLLLAPALTILIVFDFFPIFFGAFISTCDWKPAAAIGAETLLDRWTGPCVKFVGLDNYVRAFADEKMWQSLIVTATYALISLPIQLGLSLFFAYLLFQNVRGKEIFRVIFFLPYITSSVASAAVWSFLYNPDKGLINNLLINLGFMDPEKVWKWLGEPTGIFALMARNAGIALPDWLGGPSLALLAVIFYTTWVFLGYDMTLFLAGLGNIPGELYDAAKVDGASGWKLFRHITFPLLSPTTFFILIITVIGIFKAFNHIYVMTQGGPGDATTTTSIYIFQQLYQFNRYGYSAALSFILFIVILGLTIAQNRIAGSRVVYD
jgi:multiple sugar transport system permease protein